MPIADRYSNQTSERTPALHFVYDPANEVPGFQLVMDEIIAVMAIYYPFLTVTYEVSETAPGYAGNGVNTIHWKNDIEMDLLTNGSHGFVKLRPNGERDMLLNHDKIKSYSIARDVFFHEIKHALGS